MRALRLATSRYHATDLIAKSGLLPLGITVGAARWLSYELAGNVGMLAPHELRQIEKQAPFERAYRKRLDHFGAASIGSVLRAFTDAYGLPGAVLLCFEDLSKPGEWCHRRTFAAWWEEQTGDEVPELG